MALSIKFPFTIQGGSVAVTDNADESIRSQIAFCISTMFGERVMRPTWGIDLLSTVWSIGGELDAAMREAIEGAFRIWFPDYEPREITISRNADRPTYIEVEIRFGRFDSPTDLVANAGTQLPDGTEIYPNEGF